MSRRYDSRTTIFSPEGRLYQVEYAMEAIGNAGSAIGILSSDGVVLVGEKKVTSKLLQTSKSSEKMYKIDDHVSCAVAGIMSDANILINTARLQAQRYAFAYQVYHLPQLPFTALFCTNSSFHLPTKTLTRIAFHSRRFLFNC